MTPISGPIDLIRKSFQVFFEKENLIFLLKLYSPLVPFAIFFYFQNNYLDQYIQNVSVESINAFLATFGWLPILALIVGLVYLIISFWINASGIKAVSEIVGGGELNVKSTYQFAWRKIWMFSLLSIVLGLVVGFGFLLLIIPGILFLVWFHFSTFEFVTKDVGIGDAMRGSKSLVSGRFWKVFGRIIVFGLFEALVQIFVGLIPMGLGDIILPLFGGLFILPYFLLYEELLSAPGK